MKYFSLAADLTQTVAVAVILWHVLGETRNAKAEPDTPPNARQAVKKPSPEPSNPPKPDSEDEPPPIVVPRHIVMQYYRLDMVVYQDQVQRGAPESRLRQLFGERLAGLKEGARRRMTDDYPESYGAAVIKRQAERPRCTNGFCKVR